MFCPFCNAEDTRVIDSRLVSNGSQVRRRRECSKCKERYTSFEIAELVMPKVIKKTGCREPFDDAKLSRGLQKAVEKRPVSTEQLDEVLSGIALKVRAIGEREVSSEQVGAIVMKFLFELDLIAYVRFASVYWEFKDLQSFKNFVNELDYAREK
jgi:transcriptional repressor NrdR